MLKQHEILELMKYDSNNKLHQLITQSFF